MSHNEADLLAVAIYVSHFMNDVFIFDRSIQNHEDQGELCWAFLDLLGPLPNTMGILIIGSEFDS